MFTPRGNHRQQNSSSVRKITSTTLELISRFCHAEQVAIWGYCLMPNHVHLIVVPQFAESLRRAIGEAHRRYTRRINFREGWPGHLGQDRFASFVMDEDQLLTAARYMKFNPMGTRFIQAPSHYGWRQRGGSPRGRGRRPGASRSVVCDYRPRRIRSQLRRSRLPGW